MTKTNLFHDSNNSDNIQMGLPSKSTTIIAFIYFVFKMATISHHNDFHNGYQYTKLIVNTKGFFYVHNIVCQGETLCRQRVPKGSSSRKKTIPIRILLEPWHINNKIMQGMRIPGRSYSFMRQGY